MKNGDIIFFRYKFNPISIIIRFFINLGKEEKCPYNHVGMVIGTPGNFHVVESNEKGVHTTSFNSRVKKKTYEIRRMFFGNEQDVYFYASQYTDKKYDYWSVLWHYLLFYITGRWYGHSQGFAEGTFYCSELVARIINLCDPTKFQDWHKTDPRQLYLLSEKID